jgi:hypothetical protein
VAARQATAERASRRAEKLRFMDINIPRDGKEKDRAKATGSVRSIQPVGFSLPSF